MHKSLKVYDLQQKICLHFPHQNFVQKFDPNLHKIRFCELDTILYKNKRMFVKICLFMDKTVSNSCNLSLSYVNVGQIFVQSSDGENVNKSFVVCRTL